MKFSEALFRERLAQPLVRIEPAFEGKLARVVKKEMEGKGSFCETVKKCKSCEYGQASQFPPMVPLMHEMAPYLLIGQAPGQAEGTRGEVFAPTSLAGKWVREYLKVLGIAVGEVSLSTAIYCVPFKEVDLRQKCSCMLYKGWELSHLRRVKFVFLLGNAAIRAVVGNESIVKMCGRTFYSEDAEFLPGVVIYFPLFHPGTIIRATVLLKAVKEHLDWIREKFIKPYQEFMGVPRREEDIRLWKPWENG